MKNFVTVSTAAARSQNVSLNPQKLAGQCAKLKCCLNYEVSIYMDAASHIPARDISLETADKVYYQVKTDVIAGLVCYSPDKNINSADLVTITAKRAFEVIEMNRQGQKPAALSDDDMGQGKPAIVDLAEQDSLTRFDKAKKNKHKNRNRHNRDRNRSPKSNTPQEEATAE